MKQVYLLCMLCMYYSLAQAQVSLVRQVIGSAGTTVMPGGSVVISYNVGEPAVAVLHSDSITLTQGFEQPLFRGNLQFELSVQAASCPYATDGSATLSQLLGCRGPYTIEWSNGATGTVANDLGPGLFSVTVSTANCAITETFEIVSAGEENCSIRFFNAFSPNGDGTNDTWEIENIEVQAFADNEVEIFNRWGQLVYSATGYNNSSEVFKGKTASGQSLSDGTYFYVIRVNDQNYKGYIELTR